MNILLSESLRMSKQESGDVDWECIAVAVTRESKETRRCASNAGGSGVWVSASQLGRPPAMLT